VVYMKYKPDHDILVLRKNILKDLQSRDFSRDPFGFCNYLLFLLESRFEHDYLDNLVDWMNGFIREVLVEQKISRAADNEITTAILGYFILAKHNRLTTGIDFGNVNELLRHHIDDNGLYFKNNLTYSICLAFSLFSRKDKIKNWKKTRYALLEEYRNKNLQCDRKNLCYYVLLLEVENDNEELEKLSKWAMGILVRNGTNTHDKPYYLWVVWRNRKYIKREIKTIKHNIADSLENFLIKIETEEEPQSKIIKSVYYDTAKSFFGRTMLISFDEYHEPNLFARIGGFFVALILIALMVVSIYFSMKNGWLSYANHKLISTLSWKAFSLSIVKFLMSIALLLIEFYSGYIGGIILWEVPINNRYQRHEVGAILKKRSIQFLKWVFIIIAAQLILTPLLQ